MRKLNATLLLGIAVAILGFGLVLTYGRTVEKRIADGRETAKVLVASADLAAGTTTDSITTSVKLSDVPQAYVADGALLNLNTVRGKVLLGPVPKGTQLSEGLFGTSATAGAVAPSPNNVAVAVEVGLSPGVARYVSVGSIVDVFVTYTGAGDNSQDQNPASDVANRTKLFLSGAKVLAVSVAQPAPQEGTDEASATPPAANVTVVLDLNPQDAERVVNAVSVGQLYLALSTKDARHTTPSGVTPADVVGANR